MNRSTRTLATRRGEVRFPAFLPVTTFGEKYPLDDLVRPYLARLAPAAMVSYYYARKIEELPRLPLFVDSGGFVSLFESARVVEQDGLGVIEVSRGDEVEVIHPAEVLDLQERVGDVGFTLDFPIPPGMDAPAARRRFELTIRNAFWALENRRRRDLPLYGCVQAWDAESAREAARTLARAPFAGMAIGGLVPRARDRDLVRAIVEAVREEITDRPIHVFGLGKPETVDLLFELGVDSVDSSSYVKLAADGKLWNDPEVRFSEPSVTDRLHLALCNLAVACGKALPLSAARLAFTTPVLDRGTGMHTVQS
jgi:queuine/archaeosine tRNA-ribosyltransferase